jgi:hypothetical protein
MATQADNANTGIVITAFGVGTAVLIGGIAAIISMVRTEEKALNDYDSVKADHVAIAELRKEQRTALQSGRLPIDKAASEVLNEIRKNPFSASPATKPAANAPAAAPPPVEEPVEEKPAAGKKAPKKAAKPAP